MTIEKIFELSTREKFRFAYKGSIQVEDLWDLSVEELDKKIFKVLNAELKQGQEESLLDVKTKQNEVLEAKIAIVKYIVGVKQAEIAAKENEKLVQAKRKKIKEILASKQDDALKNKSEKELQEMLSELE